MKVTKIISLFILLFSIGALLGCTQTNNLSTNTSMKDTNSMMKDQNNQDTMMENFVSTYSKNSFSQAQQEGKTIILDFSANWCPICNANQPFIESGAKQLDPKHYLVQKVHYKDDQSSPEGNQAIEQFNVTGQHTIIVVGSDGKELGRTRQDFTDGSFKPWVESLA